jgi:mono/diheme cytochrome c family protein
MGLPDTAHFLNRKLSLLLGYPVLNPKASKLIVMNISAKRPFVFPVVFTAFVLLVTPLNSVYAAVAPAGEDIETSTLLSNPYFLLLSLLVVILIICIVTLSSVIKNIAGAWKTGSGVDIKTVLSLIGLVFLWTNQAQGQTPGQLDPVTTYGGMSSQVFFAMLSILVFLCVVFAVQLSVIHVLIRKTPTESMAQRPRPSLSLRVFRFGLGFALLFLICAYASFERIQLHTQIERKYQEQLKESRAASQAMSFVFTVQTVKYLQDTASLREGKELFLTNCASCHMPDGGGLVGPNLTDDYWLHGGSIGDIFGTILNGYPSKGMKTWKEDFTTGQIAKLASYIKSLHGTTPVVAKAPEGILDSSAPRPAIQSKGKTK